MVVDRKEGIITEEMDRIFSGNRVLKESRDGQGQRLGHVGVPTFVKGVDGVVSKVVQVGLEQYCDSRRSGGEQTAQDGEPSRVIQATKESNTSTVIVGRMLASTPGWIGWEQLLVE